MQVDLSCLNNHLKRIEAFTAMYEAVCQDGDMPIELREQNLFDLKDILSRHVAEFREELDNQAHILEC